MEAHAQQFRGLDKRALKVLIGALEEVREQK
jgi:hypothetical protein